MRVSRDELLKFTRAVPPAPPPIEPLLAPAEEARLIARAKPGDRAVAARRERVLALIRRPAAPDGADAELITLLAAAKALPLARPEDRVAARLRLLEIGRLAEPPPEVRTVLRRLRLEPGDSDAFATKLLPPERTIGEFYESGAGMHSI